MRGFFFLYVSCVIFEHPACLAFFSKRLLCALFFGKVSVVNCAVFLVPEVVLRRVVIFFLFSVQHFLAVAVFIHISHDFQ